MLVNTMDFDRSGSSQFDRTARSYRYYRNAVDRHWNPAEIDLTEDRQRLDDAGMSEAAFDGLRMGLARFGAGEQAVTEDLAPLAVVMERVEDQLFLTTQLYEEAKHTDFFDRYWREVIHPVEAARGETQTHPTDPRWFNEQYLELFDRNEQAVAQLVTDDTPRHRAEAYCHYHLTIEGILAQTGYYGMQQNYSADTYSELPYLPGLVDGFQRIRSDEGRHVGFGMAKLKALLLDDTIEPRVIDETITELLPLVNAAVADQEFRSDVGIPLEDLETYAAEKHTERMQQIKDAAQEIPDVDTLTRLEGD